eukprot:5039439-Prymnesium_polylepis.1
MLPAAMPPAVTRSGAQRSRCVVSHRWRLLDCLIVAKHHKIQQCTDKHCSFGRCSKHVRNNVVQQGGGGCPPNSPAVGGGDDALFPGGPTRQNSMKHLADEASAIA